MREEAGGGAQVGAGRRGTPSARRKAASICSGGGGDGGALVGVGGVAGAELVSIDGVHNRAHNSSGLAAGIRHRPLRHLDAAEARHDAGLGHRRGCGRGAGSCSDDSGMLAGSGLRADISTCKPAAAAQLTVDLASAVRLVRWSLLRRRRCCCRLCLLLALVLGCRRVLGILSSHHRHQRLVICMRRDGSSGALRSGSTDNGSQRAGATALAHSPCAHEASAGKQRANEPGT